MSLFPKVARTQPASLANYVPTPQLNGDVCLRAMESAEQPIDEASQPRMSVPLDAFANNQATKLIPDASSNSSEIHLGDLLRALAEPKTVQRDLTEPSAALRDVFRRL